jgi:IS30 family transposase
MPQEYKHLDSHNRCIIFTLRAEGLSLRAIAARANVHHATISRELKRNAQTKGGYCYKIAQKVSVARRHLACRRQSKMNQENIKILVLDQLHCFQSSPQQISGALKLKHNVNISHETIYKYIWSDKKVAGNLFVNLRHRGKKYNRRGSKTAGRGLIPGRIDILERPKIVESKVRVGDLEADLIMGADHKGAILSLVDRHSKYTKLHILSGKTKLEVTAAIIKVLRRSKHCLKTITYDNGKEFAGHAEIAKKLGVDCYFATPYCSWERGLNEHTNGLVRQYFPKGMLFDKLTQREVKRVESILNNRPREILNFYTPHEVFTAAVQSGALHH